MTALRDPVDVSPPLDRGTARDQGSEVQPLKTRDLPSFPSRPRRRSLVDRVFYPLPELHKALSLHVDQGQVGFSFRSNQIVTPLAPSPRVDWRFPEMSY